MMVGIQADDLTGACDTGAAFATRGLETVVLLPDALPPPSTPAILVLDTESRGLARAEARNRARAAAARLAAHRPAVLYKKVDSTLRGAVADELAGVLEGSELHHAVLAPAFPAQRRAVVDGLLRVDGRRADESDIARDPAFPVTGASVPALLAIEGSQRLGPIGVMPLATVRRGLAAVGARLDRWAGTARGVIVCDAETDGDLQLLGAVMAETHALLAGSAGLAGALAARIPAGASKPGTRMRRPLLVVAGSGHPATRAQVEALAARGVGGTWLGTIGAQGSDTPIADGEGRRDRLIAAQAESVGDSARARDAMAARLADTARRRLDDARRAGTLGTLLVTGGETAAAVCRALGATGLRLAGEVQPGLAQGSLLDGPFAGLTVVTKGGAFGDTDTLVRVLEACA